MNLSITAVILICLFINLCCYLYYRRRFIRLSSEICRYAEQVMGGRHVPGQQNQETITSKVLMELEKLECQLDSPVKASLLSKVRMKLNTAELRLQQLEEDLIDIKAELKDRGEDGRLECGVAYAGTEISIGDEITRLRHEEHQCVAKMVAGEILVM